MLLFAGTGITLNHAAQIEAKPRVTEKRAVLPGEMLAGLALEKATPKAPLPKPIEAWIAEQLSIRIGDRVAEWSTDEVYVALPVAGGDSWLSIDRETGEIAYEKTDR